MTSTTGIRTRHPAHASSGGSAGARRSGHRGLTLVELMIALAVTTLVIMATLSITGIQQRMEKRTRSDISILESGRVTLEEIFGNVRLAGFGLSPSLALDFGPLAQAPVTGGPAPLVPTLSSCANPVACRDRADGPDELAFYARDPSFVRALGAPPAGNTLTLASALTEPLYQGQVLQVVCVVGLRVIYARVAQTAPAGTTSVTLMPGVGNAFPQQNPPVWDPCYGNTALATDSPVSATSTERERFDAAAKVFKVDWYRYFIQGYDDNGIQTAWGAPTGRPYLMLDQGLTIGGTPQWLPVAPDVEDLQVAYVFNFSTINAGALQTQQVAVGGQAGQVIANGPAGIDLAPAVFADLGDPSTAPGRQTRFPSNIRAVRVTLVVRSPEVVTANGSDTIPAAENRPAFPGTNGYRRTVIQGSAALKNLEVRKPYFPRYAVDAPGSSDYAGLNVGGS